MARRPAQQAKHDAPHLSPNPFSKVESIVAGIVGAGRRLRRSFSGYVSDNKPTVSPYEAASPSSKLPRFPNLGPTDGSRYHRILVGAARHLFRNDAWLRRGIGVLASAVIGLGPTWNPRFPEMKEIVDAWVGEADTRGVLPLGLLLKHGYIAETVDGEVFWVLRPRDPKDGLTLNLQIQPLETDFVPHDDNRDLGNGRRVVNGVELDPLERRRAYWMHRQHPDIRGTVGTANNETFAMPAAMVLHQVRLPRFSSVRGETRLVSSIARAINLAKYEGAEQTRKIISTLFAGFITRTDAMVEPGSALGNRKKAEDEFAAIVDEVMLEPGILSELPAGTSITWSTPPDTGSSYEPYVRFALMYLAASLDVSYEDFTGDFRGLSDRTWRAAQVALRRLADEERARIEHQVLRPLYRYLVDLAIAQGLFKPPPGTPDHHLYDCSWTWPAAKNPNQFQEFNSFIVAIKNGLTSRQQAIRELGGDPRRVDIENGEDILRAEEQGVAYDCHTPSGQKGDLVERLRALIRDEAEILIRQREESGTGDGDPGTADDDEPPEPPEPDDA